MALRQLHMHRRNWCKLPSTIALLEIHNITKEIGELDFFDNTLFVWVLELDNIPRGIKKFNLFDNLWFVKMFKLEKITNGIEELNFFDNFTTTFVFVFFATYLVENALWLQLYIVYAI